MILLFPDLSTNKLRQAMELGDRLFPQDLAHLESQVNHWQAERLWINMLYETIYKEEKNRRLGLGPRKFTTHVLNCIEAAISNPGDRRLPVLRKSL
ncbi:hypothetical protein N7460_009943, partial [Penicillium canescens]